MNLGIYGNETVPINVHCHLELPEKPLLISLKHVELKIVQGFKKFGIRFK